MPIDRWNAFDDQTKDAKKKKKMHGELEPSFSSTEHVRAVRLLRRKDIVLSVSVIALNFTPSTDILLQLSISRLL